MTYTLLAVDRDSDSWAVPRGAIVPEQARCRKCSRSSHYRWGVWCRPGV